MKLASFRAEGHDFAGLSIDGATLVNLADAVKRVAGDRAQAFPHTLQDMIEAGEGAWALIRDAEAAVRNDPKSFKSYDAASVSWYAPVRRPSKLCCLALNNSANADRIMRGPKHPAMFIKPSSSLVGHNGAIECKPHYGRVHPEPELAVVIGQTAKNVTAAAAYDYVFGYTIHNDITSPNMRDEDTFHYRAIHPKAGNPNEIEYVDSWVSYPGRYKGSDTFGCVGPWLTTKDEIADPHALDVSCHHQGRLVTEDNTANLFYKIPEVIEFISGYMTLLPGDIISMGTALKKSAKGGAVQNIDLNKMGGPVSVTIQGLGTLSNEVKQV